MIEYIFMGIFGLIFISCILVMLYIIILSILAGILYIIEKFDINWKITKKIKFNRWLIKKDENTEFLYFKIEENGYQRWTYLPKLISNYRLFPSSFIESEKEIRKHTDFENYRLAKKKEIKKYGLNTLYAKLLLMKDA
jgi:hypothetical protein